MPSPAKPVKAGFGDRQLAAIVFTDVAGFSSLMEANETRTMVLVQRDLKLIADVCREFGGNVLKNTGDGCLAAFHSVEAAVRSALKIQGIIVDAGHRLPPEKILHHRIGIHLGDVFLGKGDVLGNGVNIAARLLGEAEPDGICISQAVYDVVKHRLGVKAVCIGARELKNIREAMPVYRLLLGAAAEEQGEAAPPIEPPQSHRMLYAGVLAALLLIAMTSAITWVLIRSRHGESAGQASANSATTPTTEAVVTSLLAAPATQPTVTYQSVQQIMQRNPDFTANSADSWTTFPHFENEIQKCGAQDNFYLMTLASPTFRAAVVSSPWGTFDDVTIEVTGRVHEQTRAWWGITLAATDASHRVVRVLLNSNGLMRIDLSHLTGNEGVAHPLRPEELRSFADRSIRRFGNPNTMALQVRNHQLSVFANGQPIGKTTDISAVGRAAIMLSVEGNKDSQAEFDQMRVWLPVPVESNTAGSK